jgi:Cof subfamily protein (haloacid dehalogenase superfamily)
LIKLVTIDLDGTLLDSRSEISKENREAIKCCMDKGIKVCLSTGKSMRCAEKIIRDLGLKDLQITSGGTMVVDSQLKPIYIKRIPRRITIKAARLAMENDVGFVLETTDGLLYYERYYPEIELFYNSGEVIEKVDDILTDHIVDNSLLFTFTVNKDHPFNSMLANNITKEVKIRRGGRYFLNILKADAGKVFGLKKIIEAYGICQSQVMAIGDNNNDKGTLEFAGLSVAMGNATDEIKEMADHVTVDNDNSGVAKAIYNHIEL